MKTIKNLLIILAVIFVISVIGFSTRSQTSNFSRNDEQNIRAMFHLAPSVKMVSFNSFPKQSGTFGREGLQIHAVFQFNEQQFTNYVTLTKDTNIWKPVLFKGRTPAIEKKFTEQSCEWKPLPLTSNVWGSENDRPFILKEQMEQVKEGMYHCTISHTCHDVTPIYAKRYSCDESSGLSDRPSEAKYGFSRTIGVLDTKNQKLYVEYRL